MAERRMFTKKITDADAFLDMPMSAQCLYFHLNMSADDDGFVNSPKSIQRKIGASNDDLNLLLAKKFVLSFDTGVIVIKHWKMHNYIQSDRYKPTDYMEEKAMLTLDEKKAYSFDVSNMYTECIQDVSIGKDRLGKDRLGKDRLGYISEKSPVYYPNDDVLDEAFKSYVQMRKKIKAPMTERAIELAIKKLENLSGGDNDIAVEILNQSIMNSWKGLFELPQAKQKQTASGSIDWSQV